MLKLRAIFIYFSIFGMIITIVQSVPLLNEVLNDQKIELAKKSETNETADYSNDAEDDTDDDDSESVLFLSEHLDVLIFHSKTKSLTARNLSLYKFLLYSIQSPPPKI